MVATRAWNTCKCTESLPQNPMAPWAQEAVVTCRQGGPPKIIYLCPFPMPYDTASLTVFAALPSCVLRRSHASHAYMQGQPLSPMVHCLSSAEYPCCVPTRGLIPIVVSDSAAQKASGRIPISSMNSHEFPPPSKRENTTAPFGRGVLLSVVVRSDVLCFLTGGPSSIDREVPSASGQWSASRRLSTRSAPKLRPSFSCCGHINWSDEVLLAIKHPLHANRLQYITAHLCSDGLLLQRPQIPSTSLLKDKEWAWPVPWLVSRCCRFPSPLVTHPVAAAPLCCLTVPSTRLLAVWPSWSLMGRRSVSTGGSPSGGSSSAPPVACRGKAWPTLCRTPWCRGDPSVFVSSPSALTTSCCLVALPSLLCASASLCCRLS